jgi:hypothetical protein
MNGSFLTIAFHLASEEVHSILKKEASPAKTRPVSKVTMALLTNFNALTTLWPTCLIGRAQTCAVRVAVQRQTEEGLCRLTHNDLRGRPR